MKKSTFAGLNLRTGLGIASNLDEQQGDQLLTHRGVSRNRVREANKAYLC
jgi:hypothetical protein